MAEFLFEIGLEEVPARMLASAEAELKARVDNLLISNALSDGSTGATQLPDSYSTPRRLAVLFHDVKSKQSDLEDEVVGPPVKVSYVNGLPAAPGLAFAQKWGVNVSQLYTVKTAKGEYIAARVFRKGKPALEVIARALPSEIAAIYWAKNMYWRPGKPERFVRPVQWLLALLDGEVVPVEWGGKTAGRITYGHRVLYGDAPIEIAHAGDYESRLYEAKVIASVEDRRHKIRKALDAVTRAIPEARWREDHPLVDKVTHMTEWPAVTLGAFEAEFLALPEEVLVTVMRDHQNYFAVENADHALAPHFLAVLNTEPDATADGIIRHGNERVLRARFSDARFFYEFDQRVPLTDRIALLEKVTFQKDLGSYAAKAERVRSIAARLGAIVQERWAATHSSTSLDLEALDTAAQLCKTDLTTELVKEFTELQGIVGGLYASAQGHGEAVAQAIYAHYQPVGMDDAIPPTVEGQLLAVADKIDSISGMFGLGLQPTGSKDPFALRRAANGIVKILAESTLPLLLSEIAAAAMDSDTALSASVLAFLSERLEWYLREVRGCAYDVVKAVMATHPDDVRDAMARVDAVSAARDSEDFAAIAAAFRRMKNILEQARAKGDAITADVSLHVLVEPAERVLAEESARRAEIVETLRREHQYPAALTAIAELRAHVDAFFDKVMVMVPDQALRHVRLSLLSRVLNDFSNIADFSEIVIAG